MLEPGGLRLDLHLVGTRLGASHDVEPSQYEPGIPDALQPQRHLLDLEMTDATLVTAIGLSQHLNLELELPFRRVSIDALFESQDGQLLPGFESIHHRTETISGLADIGISLRWRIAEDAGGWTIDLRPGLTVPTGDTEPDPFELGEQGEPHQHIFFGTGSWDPQLGLDAFRRTGPFSLNGWFRGRFPVGESSEGYQAGSRTSSGFGASRALGASRWSVRGQLELYHEKPSRFETQEARNSGRTDLILGAGLGWRVPRSPLVAHLLVRLPDNLSSRGGQIDPRPVVTLGLSLALDR